MKPERNWELLSSNEGAELDGEELFGSDVWNGLVAEIESAVSRPTGDAISEYEKALKEVEALNRAFEAEMATDAVPPELVPMEEAEVKGTTDGSQLSPTVEETAGGIAQSARYCRACGMRVPPTARFCGQCGGPIPAATAREEPGPATCPSCGAAQQPGMKFCGNCGRKSPSRS